jgi:hypothetical protein
MPHYEVCKSMSPTPSSSCSLFSPLSSKKNIPDHLQNEVDFAHSDMRDCEGPLHCLEGIPWQGAERDKRLDNDVRSRPKENQIQQGGENNAETAKRLGFDCRERNEEQGGSRKDSGSAHAAKDAPQELFCHRWELAIVPFGQVKASIENSCYAGSE